MAEVFLARQRGPEGWGRPVAVKRILPHLVETEDFVRMFLDEARLAARLNHPNVVHIYEFGKVEEYFFIAMEYVDGVDVNKLIQLAAREPVPPEIVARIGADAAAGLHHAHNVTDPDGRPVGIVHRDVSPQNLLVSYDGVLKIVDFGIAKATHQAERTRPGVVKGKFAYMSPEQTIGKSLDGRSDVFSLGLCLWELLAGRVAVKRDDPMAGMKLIRDGRLPPIEAVARHVPPELARIVNRALAREPHARPNAGQLGLELEGYLKSATSLATLLVVGEWLRVKVPRESTQSGSYDALAAPPQGTVPATQATAHAAVATPSRATPLPSTATPPRPAPVPVPDLVGKTVPEAPLTALVPPPPRRRWFVPALIGALAAGVAVALVIVFSHSSITPATPAERSTAPVGDPTPSVTSLPDTTPSSSVAAASPVTSTSPSPSPSPSPSTVPEVASLDVSTTPKGAVVVLDGGRLDDRTPLHLPSVPPGEHTIVLSLTNHRDLTRTITLAPGEHRSLELVLTSAPKPPPPSTRKTGYLTVRTIPWSEVSIGRRKLGTTPLADVELPVGTHRITFRNPEVGSHVRRVRIKPGETTKLSLTLGE